MSDESILMLKIFKAKYFPQIDFIYAKLGKSPSYVWKCIWETRHLLKEWSR